jgi:hypothetical protein
VQRQKQKLTADVVTHIVSGAADKLLLKYVKASCAFMAIHICL